MALGRRSAFAVCLVTKKSNCRSVMAIDILRRIRERSYQIWEQEGRPEGRHLNHWLQAEYEQLAQDALDFEFQLTMRAFRSGIISETTVEEVMTDLEKRALSDDIRISSKLGLLDRG